MSLQLPGLSFGTGEPTTVEIEFLDSADTPLYIIKGEVFSQTMPMRKENTFYPDGLTGSDKYIKTVRIKAGESGMTLKLFESPEANLPKMILFMKAGFIMSNNQPIDISVFEAEEHRDTDLFNLHWYSRDLKKMTQLKGMHVGKIELYVHRDVNQNLVPKGIFGIVGAADSSTPAQALNAVIYDSSKIHSNNVAVVPENPNTRPVQMVVLNPAGSQFPS